MVQNAQPTVLPAGPPSREWIEVGPVRTTLSAAIGEARMHFAQFRAIQVTQMLEPGFLETILRLCATIQFEPEEFNAGFREKEKPPRGVSRALSLALGRPETLRWLEQVTGCEPLKDIAGGIARTLARPGDELLWHDDLVAGEGRRLAVVIDLSTERYTGGEFELRSRDSPSLFKHRYERLGSALIFEVGQELEHRVLPLRIGGPRQVYAGWARGKTAS